MSHPSSVSSTVKQQEPSLAFLTPPPNTTPNCSCCLWSQVPKYRSSLNSTLWKNRHSILC